MGSRSARWCLSFVLSVVGSLTRCFLRRHQAASRRLDAAFLGAGVTTQPIEDAIPSVGRTVRPRQDGFVSSGSDVRLSRSAAE